MAEAPAPAPKKERKKRTHKPPQIPAPETFEGAAKEQFVGVMEASKSLLEAVKGTTLVPLSVMRDVRRAVQIAMLKDLQGRKADPTERKRQRLEASILKAQQQLKDLGAV